MESVYVMTGREIWRRMTKFWGVLFGINFAMGVATGITMEFQFGMNWAYYSHYVGDVFGAPLAIEGLMAFFLEATFIGLFFFGWDKLSKVAHLTVTWLVALGTHQPMSTEALALHLGPVTGTVRNHDWADDGTFVSLGSIGSSEMAELTNGRLDEEVEVRINRLVAEADAALVCGPVFPHEVVGYSGGNKYFFPGVSGPEVIDATHWLGALHTSRALIGTLGVTPVRAVIDRAASMVPTLRCATCFVVAPGGTRLAGIFPGTPEESFAAAAALSAEVHVRWLDHPVRRVISILPERYDDMWTGAKGMYKVEPVVRDGGEVLLFAPHITEFSRTHGALLAEIGYHVRDYFVGQWGSFSRIPGRVLAHSTHLRGDGTWSEDGGERPRITVTLATGIDEDRCRQHGLGYLDPAAVDLAALRADPDEDLLVVEEAGETLYRLRPDSSRTAAASSPSSASSG